ncbi:probable peptidyl-tRNA hydrolase 2 [Anarrhichthys ocellatus]|uniref:probable peptidyl-tRNA hydrolase 2 n=1 Tax=Anarrhichthys ocellatus TaxID=433405 RepID=UPI0012ECC08B|nr:probable peptidyl-tRNA hydrolase 2 [Anarrhichthys ocellatus]
MYIKRSTVDQGIFVIFSLRWPALMTVVSCFMWVSDAEHCSSSLQSRMEPTEQPGPDSQEVNPVFLQQLRELDIPEEAAKQALLHTRNVSAEEAAMYYFNKLENEEEGDDDLVFKMVFVVNMDLAMGVGKVAAQVGHAAVGLYQALQEKNSWREMAWKWDHSGAKKVVVQGTNVAHLLELQALAMSLSLPTYLVQHAGMTQVEAGSRTVLAIMGEEEMVNNITGSLKLL